MTISPDMDVYYAAGLFLKNNFGRFPRRRGRQTRRGDHAL
jgi:hypothetical protein